MKVSDIIKIWDKLNEEYIEGREYTDFEKIVDEVVGVENDMSDHPPLCRLTEKEIEALEDEADLKTIEERKDEPRIPWDEAKKQLGLD